MYQHPVVKPAFHLSWFLLLLGGMSLMLRDKWEIVGAVMIIAALVVFGFTALAIYMHKPIVKEPGWILLLSMGLLVLLIIAEVLFGKFMLAMILAVLSTPILMGWSKIKGQKSGAKKKR